MTMSNKTYDILKWVAQIGLPAFATFIATLWSLYHLPHGNEIVGTIVAIDTFLGYLLKKSSDNYNGDGTLIVDTSDPFKDVYSIAIDDYPSVLSEKDKVLLNVHRPAHMKE